MDPVKPLDQINLEDTKMQVTREEKSLNFWPRIKEFGSPLAIVGFGVAGHPRQLKVLHTKRPEKPIQAFLPEPPAPKSESVCQKPFVGQEEEKTLKYRPRSKEFVAPPAAVVFGESGHMRRIKVLSYREPEEPSQALVPEPAAPKREAVCQKPFNGGEGDKGLTCELKTKEPGKPLLPEPAAPKPKPRKMAGFDDAKHQRLRYLKRKVHPARVVVADQPDNRTQPPPLGPEKTGSPKAEDSSPAPKPTKTLGVGSLVEKFKDFKEKKDQKRRQKAEEQYARWTAYKSRYPGMFSQQQNDAYADGFDAGRKGILKSMF